ncbi:GxxExxY protein [Flavobacterium sp.]|uniref:GxxExxY protein n=1 Tax=Flavobacterium sp. TaxID=239 RepID=UPI0026043FC1|nr:GxxExxY protein [Flavobacterium sp.]
MEDLEKIAKDVVHCAYLIHKQLGPGLLEKVYEICLEFELKNCGYDVKRQTKVPINYKGIEFTESLRLDVLVNDSIIIEVKAVEISNPVWDTQIISHLKLTNKKIGFLINFNVPIIKQGIKRFVN